MRSWCVTLPLSHISCKITLSYTKMYRIYVVWEQKWFSLIIPGLLLAGDLSKPFRTFL